MCAQVCFCKPAGIRAAKGRAGMRREGRAGDRDGDGLPDLSGESWQEWARIRVMEMRGL